MIPSTYQQLLERLFSSRRAGVVLGLERVQACLDALGHPEQQPALRVHIGGTNGKGSTSAFVDSMLRAAGRRTGLFTSPHLVRFAERFRIGGEPASEAAILAAAAATARAGGDELTFFEQVTVMGLWLFAEAGVDTLVLEVGLGGRLDATNAVAAEVAAVTGVAMDHQEYLGSTLAAIAGEKAGIFKPGQRVVIGRSGEPEAVPLLAARAAEAGAQAITIVDAPVPAGWPLGLAGAYQRDNAACALAILEHVQALGHVDADPAWRQRGLAEARWPGRLETVAHDPEVILDGAHNPHAARALAEAMARLRQARQPLVLVVGVSADKDIAGILEPLAAHADVLIATQYSQPRAMPAQALADLAAEIAPALARTCEPTVASALARARELAGPGGVVVATGSLFLVGEARQALCGETPDPLPVTDPMGAGPRVA